MLYYKEEITVNKKIPTENISDKIVVYELSNFQTVMYLKSRKN